MTLTVTNCIYDERSDDDTRGGNQPTHAPAYHLLLRIEEISKKSASSLL